MDTKQRRERVSKETYNILRKELLAILKTTGYKLKTKRYPVRKWMYAARMPYGSYHGTACAKTKTISLKIWGRPAYWEQLHVLAHEVRHALHHKNDLFSDYYRLEHYEIWNDLAKGMLPSDYRLPCLRTAYLAELDCDKWAYKFLYDRGIDLPYPKPYPASSTMARKIHNEVKIADSKFQYEILKGE